MKYISALIMLIILSACSTSGTSIILDESIVYEPTDPADIKLILSPPQRVYTEFAIIDGSAATDDYFTNSSTKEAAIKALKKEAARIGADAVLITNTSTSSSALYWELITVTGKAIKYD